MPLAAAVALTGLAGAGVSMAASNKAAKASQNATDQSIALQRELYNDAQARQAPFVQAGYGAVNALTGRLGLDTAPVAGAITAANQNAAGANGGMGSLSDAQAQQLLDANPDVLQAYQTAKATADPNSPAYAQAGLDNPLNYARNWYSNMGGSARYQLPGATAAPAPAAGQATLTDQAIGLPTQTPIVKSGDPTPQTIPAQPQTAPAGAVTTGSNNPAAFGQPAGTNALTGQPSAASLTGNPYSFGNSGNPTFTDPGFKAPAPFSYTLSDYTASPAYKWQLDQALKGVQASAAANGSLYSGDTLKALSDRAENVALQDFNNERANAEGLYQDQRNYDTANYDTNRAFAYQNYADARNYLTNQANTQTGNLFNLTQLGSNAVGNVQNAGTNYANTATNALTNNAATQANAGLAGANAINGVLSGGLNTLSYNNAVNALRPSASGGASVAYDPSMVNLGAAQTRLSNLNNI